MKVLQVSAAIIQAAILAGGLATRLRPLTWEIPKSMVQIQGRPFLAFQLELLRAAGLKEVVLCVGHLGEQIQAYFQDGRHFGLHLTYSWEQDELLGTGGALKKALPLLKPRFFVLYGDSYLDFPYQEMVQAFLKTRCPAMMAVYRNAGRFDRSNAVLRDGLVAVYNKKIDHPGMDYIDYGISILTRAVLSELPSGCACDLADLYAKLAQEKRLCAHEVHQRFYEIGSPEGLKDFQDYILKRSGK